MQSSDPDSDSDDEPDFVQRGHIHIAGTGVIGDVHKTRASGQTAPDQETNAVRLYQVLPCQSRDDLSTAHVKARHCPALAVMARRVASILTCSVLIVEAFSIASRPFAFAERHGAKHAGTTVAAC